MRLAEHPDFDQAIIRAAEHFGSRGLRPAIIEKDYFVTEALRAIADHGGDRVIFKGGTSLSKGWNLIDRFSEDIDLCRLAAQPEVVAMLGSPEYAAIKTDYDAISRAHFSRDYFRPPEMSFAQSDAIFPSGELALTLGVEYEQQCQMLCYGPFPDWSELRARMEGLRALL